MGSDRLVTLMGIAQNEKAVRFRTLNDGPGAFVIPNPWDVCSALILAGLGFQALATSSAASACVLGRKDHGLTRDEALAHARSIIGASVSKSCRAPCLPRCERVGAGTSGCSPKLLLTAKRNLIRSLFILLTV